MKVVIANINSVQNSQTAEEYAGLIKLLENAGYEIAWQNYPYTASIIKEIQNEGE